MSNLFDKLRKPGNRFNFILCSVLTVITAGINLYGYFNLPNRITTQFSFTGESNNTMSTPLYLIISFMAVLLISIYYNVSKNEQKIKWLFTELIITIANFIAILIQL
jgi:uncharacterized membrane protein